MNNLQTKRERLLQLARWFSDPAHWQMLFDQVEKIQQHRERLSREYELLRATKAKESPGLDELRHSIQGLERWLEIREADELANRQDLMEFANLIREFAPELLALVPAISSTNRPADAEFRQYAQQCRSIEARLQVHENKKSEAANPKRRRSTKAEKNGKVMQAIHHKMNNPEATEKECAECSGIAQSTLNGDKEWQTWFPQIEQAYCSGKVTELKRRFDARSGDYIIEDVTDS